MGWIMGFEESGPPEGWVKKCPVDTFLARGRIHGTQAAAPKSRRQVPFSILRRSWLEAPQNAFDPELTKREFFQK